MYEDVIGRCQAAICNDVSVDLRRSAPAEDLAGPTVHPRGDEADLLQAQTAHGAGDGSPPAGEQEWR